MIRRPLAVLSCLCLAVALAACGAKEDDPSAAPQREKLTLVLDYFPNADHAGLYAAEATGAFERAGLDVEIETPSDPSAPLKLVQAGRADLAISYEPEVLLARDKGAEVTSVAALVTQPLTSLVSLPAAGIRSPADLVGKTVGTAGIPYQAAYLRTILEEAGIDPARVKQVDVGFNLVPALLSKKVDAVLGAFWNYEGTELERARRRPQIIRMERAGVPPYDELVLVAQADALAKRGPVVRRFLQALQQGTRALREDPSVGIDPLLKANPDLDRGLQEAVVERTLPLFFPEDEEQPFGWQDPEQRRRYARWMEDQQLLERPATETSFTNEFLPGEGVRPAEETPGTGS